MSRLLVPGVVIEGLEYSGKTTLARHLARALADRGLAARPSHAVLCQGVPLLAAMMTTALAVFDDGPGPAPTPRAWRTFNTVRSAQLLTDAHLYAAQDDARLLRPLVVQDRYWLTQRSFNDLFTPRSGLLDDAWVSASAPAFTTQVYLTCRTATRARRAARRDSGAPPKHGLNLFLRQSPDTVAALDALTLDRVGADPAWLVLDTDTATPDDLARTVLHQLLPRLSEPPRVVGLGWM
ncbi:cytidylate kinase [Streptacidiphilus sp. MAP12-33]|uniref:hypothetical protein n=1 Tax=Streptacidiphilus sp. MAP12-33 TaxID=3156266 RepID=UPI0035165097